MLSNYDKAKLYVALAIARAKQNSTMSGIHEVCLRNHDLSDDTEIWNIDWFRANAKIAKAAAEKAKKLGEEYSADLYSEAFSAAEEAEFFVELAEFENQVRTNI